MAFRLVKHPILTPNVYSYLNSKNQLIEGNKRAKKKKQKRRKKIRNKLNAELFHQVS